MAAIYNREGFRLRTVDDINHFLSAGVHENSVLEFKSDFPNNLEKTIAALANTYGGTILIGVEETKAGTAVTPVCGIPSVRGVRERIIQLALDNIYPPVIPDVDVITFENLHQSERAVVVVRVPESDMAPHTVDDRTAVYLRADNVSKRERRATIGEIEWLINKRSRSLNEKEALLSQARAHAEVERQRRASRRKQQPIIAKGRIRIYTTPMYPREPLIATGELMQTCQASRTRPVPTFAEMPSGTPTRVPSGLIFSGSEASVEFRCQGMIFHDFDFWWDRVPGDGLQSSPRILPPKVSASLMWGALDLAGRFYAAVGYFGLVECVFEFSGVQDAMFVAHAHDYSYEPCPIIDDVIAVHRTHPASSLREHPRDLAADCQRELYWNCGIEPADFLINRDFAGSQNPA